VIFAYNRQLYESERSTAMTLAILYFPDEYSIRRGPLKRGFDKLGAASHVRRDPRNRSYIETLVQERTKGNTMQWLELPRQWWQGESAQKLEEACGTAEEIWLLWPDGNGYGWSKVERSVWKSKRPKVKLVVLNGRRRFFELTPKIRRMYQLRRILERLWVGEVGFTLVLLLIAPFLVGWDFARGRQ
jgi:hypothetical protein